MEMPPTRYLLRLDDLCPTARWKAWNRVLALAAATGIRPVIALVPRNEDPELVCDAPAEDFWARARALEAAGATIALHGLTHCARSRGRALLPLHRSTEFAGLPRATQQAWIREGLAILRGNGLTPRLWIAPRHGFDRVTLAALRAEGIDVLSDGFAARPFRRGGLLWLPQQLWGPAEQPPGLWTLLLHPNTATEAELDAVELFLRRHARQFIGFDQALADFPPTHYGLRLALAEKALLLRRRLLKLRKHLRIAGMFQPCDRRAGSSGQAVVGADRPHSS